jgi:hypothetical protein
VKTMYVCMHTYVCVCMHTYVCVYIRMYVARMVELSCEDNVHLFMYV